MTDLEAVAYSDGNTSLTGWLARPTGPAKAAIVLFPTIANVNDHMRRRATLLGELGYLTLIADFYGVPVPDLEGARSLAQTLRATPAGYRRRLAAAHETLRGLPATQGLATASIGYCMGGQAALELARSGADIAAAVSYHGLLTTGQPAEPGHIKARLLVCHGDADPLVPRDHVLAFWEELDRAGARWHFHSYGGAKHGFTDTGSDARGDAALAYDASADRDSWAATLALFDEVFG